MKKLLLFTMLLGINCAVWAQNQYLQAHESDPEAKVILEKLKIKYDGLEQMEADFTLKIEIPEEDAIEQKGKIAQSGEQYRLEMPEQSIISDGTTLWYHLKNNNEVQINDAEDLMEEDEFLSPQKVIDMYENGDFIYVLTDEYSKDKTIVQHIDFKPVDKESDFFKLRVVVDKKQNNITEVKAFSKDGSRYTFKLLNFDTQPTFAKNHFSFNPKAYPDIYVEDLRL